MTGRIHRAAERRFAPWKNGGGETAEVICHPEGAGFDDFQWRLSNAKVGGSGPFSVFPGIERVLTVLEGGAMVLRFEDGSVIETDPGSGPHPFDGGLACEAELPGTGLLDLNLMVRAPLRGVVLQPGEAVAGTGVLGAYLFAREDRAELGLGRYDLVELDGAPESVPDGCLLILILEA